MLVFHQLMSYITENKNELSKRHYVRNARTQSYWFDFTVSRVNGYQNLYGDNFCLILNGSDESDDTYIMPFVEVKDFFDPAFTDARNRWIGNIQDNVIRLNPGSRSMSVTAYYNAFDLLNFDEQADTVKDAIFSNDSPDLKDIKEKIIQLNQFYSEVKPTRRQRISEQVGRPNAITDYLKRFHKYVCQLCKVSGFKQRNGSLYAEAHHIYELHRLLPGSYCSDNVVIVCPTCHRKLHFASVKYQVNQESVIVEINGDSFTFERNTFLSIE